MKIYHHINDFKKLENAIVTIGTFDGVHLGHQKIISKLVSEAKNNGGESVILTFFPHPRMILHPEDHEIKMICTMEEKAILIEALGVNHLIITPFTRDFSNQSAEEYIKDILVNKIGMREIVIGYDHRFGKNRSGGFKELEEYSAIYNYQLNEIPKKDIENLAVSSTRIRKALTEANVDEANELMGHPFSLSGKVIKGDQIGRTLGYPTANLFIDENYKIIPSDGIYAVQVHIPEISNKNKNQVIQDPFQPHQNLNNETRKFKGMAYIGHRPTINGMSQNIEVNIFDFAEDIYHQTIKMDFFHFIRHDVKFEGLDKLILQLEKDKESTLAYFKNKN